MTASVSVPENVTFEGAIAIAGSLLDGRETETLSENEFAAAVSELVKSQNGARGFFVTYLTDDRAIADNASVSTRKALESSPEIVSELLVKNIAMSTAMAIYHRRQQNEEMTASSDRVRSRCSRLIRALNLPALQPRLQQLLESAETGEGTYGDFLKRWGYDAEQRNAIAESVRTINN
ncbi:hypothetical protein [Lyngbya sp. CCY1209]|uniref:hypothetical protein n=1 Tax=Lyngbya sp. CCY1209 TaxID=2886103 RepID=UPI002D200452|nr:hypothetical protein [Lyngbya sp. CCY1209]MEB3882605.1 hypothetical protein [Lyngbya sp. CCY1209]